MLRPSAVHDGRIMTTLLTLFCALLLGGSIVILMLIISVIGQDTEHSKSASVFTFGWIFGMLGLMRFL